MPRSGYKGISFPFRISPQGGVVMTTTDAIEPTHIKEGIQQILETYPFERVMEAEFQANLASTLFEPNDETLQNVVRSRIVEVLNRLEDRIQVEEDAITFSTDDGFLYATIVFKVLKYETWYEETFKIGEVM